MATTLLAFLLAVGVLIAVHEWGHYRMALACGVKVLRLSIGFGPVVLSHTSSRTGIEYTISLLPLGGYVRMLDEREAPVPMELLPRAFNRQPLLKRALIVSAGPVANLVLAVLLYAAVGMYGVEQATPILSEPVPGSLAAQAQMRSGDRVTAVAWGDESPAQVRSFEELRWVLTRAALSAHDVVVFGSSAGQHWTLPLSRLDASDPGPELFVQMGILAPFASAVIADVSDGDVAQKAGLQPGDRVLVVDGQHVPDAVSLRQRIQASASEGEVREQVWRIERNGNEVTLRIQPRMVTQDGRAIGRIGAAIGGPVDKLMVRYGVLEGLRRGIERTGEIAALTLRVFSRMAMGEASLRNISGPITVADYAGRSASSGWVHYVLFVAMVSISLGVLNLLPIPMLDGGHLMYYLWEWITGAPPSERWLEGLQRAGVAVLTALMGVAVWNDVARLLS